MFYDKTFMNSKLFGKVWKLAHNIVAEDDENCNLPRICNKLDTFVSNDPVEAHKTFSLRTSSHLINGAAKMYKSGIDKLVEDLKQLDESMTQRKRKFCHISSIGSNVSPESVQTPEQMRSQFVGDFGHISDPEVRSKPGMSSGSTSVHSPILRPKRLRISRVHTLPPDHTSITTGLQEDDGICNTSNQFTEAANSCKKMCKNVRNSLSNVSSNNTITSLENQSKSRGTNGDVNFSKRNRSWSNIAESDHSHVSQEVKKVDRGVQTDPIFSTTENRHEQIFDQNYAFGYTMIYNDNSSRIPSMIIISSINRDVINLN